MVFVFLFLTYFTLYAAAATAAKYNRLYFINLIRTEFLFIAE